MKFVYSDPIAQSSMNRRDSKNVALHFEITWHVTYTSFTTLLPKKQEHKLIESIESYKLKPSDVSMLSKMNSA